MKKNATVNPPLRCKDRWGPLKGKARRMNLLLFVFKRRG